MATGRYGALLPASALIGLKVSIDIAFHLWSVHLYRRWVGDAKGNSVGWALLAALAEPFSFQLLRHVGAALGWVSFLAGSREWKAQERFGFDKGESR